MKTTARLEGIHPLKWIEPAKPVPIVEIKGEDGRVLLSIAPDGTVTGEVADAEGAARVFVDHIRRMNGQFKGPA